MGMGRVAIWIRVQIQSHSTDYRSFTPPPTGLPSLSIYGAQMERT